MCLNEVGQHDMLLVVAYSVQRRGDSVTEKGKTCHERIRHCGYELIHPDNRDFSWHAKNGEKRKTSRNRVKILMSMREG